MRVYCIMCRPLNPSHMYSILVLSLSSPPIRVGSAVRVFISSLYLSVWNNRNKGNEIDLILTWTESTNIFQRNEIYMSISCIAFLLDWRTWTERIAIATMIAFIAQEKRTSFIQFKAERFCWRYILHWPDFITYAIIDRHGLDSIVPVNRVRLEGHGRINLI